MKKLFIPFIAAATLFASEHVDYSVEGQKLYAADIYVVKNVSSEKLVRELIDKGELKQAFNLYKNLHFKNIENRLNYKYFFELLDEIKEDTQKDLTKVGALKDRFLIQMFYKYALLLVKDYRYLSKIYQSVYFIDTKVMGEDEAYRIQSEIAELLGDLSDSLMLMNTIKEKSTQDKERIQYLYAKIKTYLDILYMKKLQMEQKTIVNYNLYLHKTKHQKEIKESIKYFKN